MVTDKINDEMKCEFCGYKYTDEVIKIAKRLDDVDPCYCSIIDKIYKLKKKVKKLKKVNSSYFSFLMEHDDLLNAFQEWENREEED